MNGVGFSQPLDSQESPNCLMHFIFSDQVTSFRSQISDVGQK